eukprot:445748-Rhodomonas_salina.2
MTQRQAALQSSFVCKTLFDLSPPADSTASHAHPHRRRHHAHASFLPWTRGQLPGDLSVHLGRFRVRVIAIRC